jgi:hypothetical protein
LLTGMTCNSLHMQWPLTSQLHGSVSQREQLVNNLSFPRMLHEAGVLDEHLKLRKRPRLIEELDTEDADPSRCLSYQKLQVFVVTNICILQRLHTCKFLPIFYGRTSFFTIIFGQLF